jgi:hypothetical protein
MKKGESFVKKIVVSLTFVLLLLSPISALDEYSVGLLYTIENADEKILSQTIETLGLSLSTIVASKSILEDMSVLREDSQTTSIEKYSEIPISFTPINALQKKDIQDPIVLQFLAKKSSFDTIFTFSYTKFNEFYRLKIFQYSPRLETLTTLSDTLFETIEVDEITVQLVHTLLTQLGHGEYAFIRGDSSSAVTSFTIDNERQPLHTIVPLSPKEHTITVEFVGGGEYSTSIYLQEGEWRTLSFGREEQEDRAILITAPFVTSEVSISSLSNISLPFVSFVQYPFVLEITQQGYMDKQYIINSPIDELQVKMKRIEFDPSIIIEQSQGLFYSSLARTALLALVSIGTQTLADDSPVLTTFFNGAIIVSSLESIYRLFDYYNKSKYSVSN